VRSTLALSKNQVVWESREPSTPKPKNQSVEVPRWEWFLEGHAKWYPEACRVMRVHGRTNEQTAQACANACFRQSAIYMWQPLETLFKLSVSLWFADLRCSTKTISLESLFNGAFSHEPYSSTISNPASRNSARRCG
jgi:hypothetical protein